MQEALILLAGHFLCDFPLQHRMMLEDKYQALKTTLGTLTLTAHAATHGLILGGLTALLGHQTWMIVGLVVFASHWLIDLGKIRGRYGVLADQVLHYAVILVLTLWINQS